MPHTPVERLDEDLYIGVEQNIVYACTDVALRDAETGKIFLGMRQTEPQLGPWFVGGRNKYATGISENAALQIKNDLGMDVPAGRFRHVATYSTDFPIAAPGREDHGRHTMNATMGIDLQPDEVTALNRKVAEGDIRNEYSSGAWYDPAEIAKPDSDFPYVIKQYVRDLYAHDLMMKALEADAYAEDDQRTAEREAADALAVARGGVEQVTKDKQNRIQDIERFGFAANEAADLESTGAGNALYGITWAHAASQEFDTDQLASFLEEMTPDQKVGDAQIKRMLRAKGITPPEVLSDNGPVLRQILNTAAKAIKYNQLHNGEIFAAMDAPKSLGRPGTHTEEQL